MAYEALAAVYDWLTPDTLLTPEASAEAFATVVDALPAGGRVLDCACGTGQLAVGLTLRGFDVAASDASPAMVARTRALAAARGVALEPAVRRWEDLAWDAAFDAVLCVGNSLVHASGTAGRRAALAGMRRAMRPGGLLAVTSRNWELEHAGLEVADRLVERDGQAGLVVYAWGAPARLDERAELSVAVALLGPGGAVTTHCERLELWPFSHGALEEDLRAAGVEPGASTWTPQAERYLVTARAPRLSPPAAP